MIGRETLVTRFAEQVAARPDHVAVRTPGHVWTYRQLDEYSDRQAAALCADGGDAGPRRVALLFRHDAPMVGAVLGALKAGYAYVPLDAAYPQARLALMLEDCGARRILTETAHVGLARALNPADGHLLVEEADGKPDPDALPQPGDEAYVLYTSGSTGRPKPVVQSHRNVLHHADAWIGGLGIGAADRISLQSAYSWDSAVQDTFAALLSGGTLLPIDLKAIGVAGLIDWMRTTRVSVYHSTLPIFRNLTRAMRDQGTELPDVRVLALGGDHIHQADLEAYHRGFSDDCLLASAYGSTECSCALLMVADKSYRPPGAVLPLGRPVHATAVRLLDETGAVVDGPGDGEIVVYSEHLAEGRAPVAGDPASHRTGDLARRRADGTLELLGRRDFQVKISGIRVDVAEVEDRLKRGANVEDAVVAAHEDESGERRLVAYVVPARGSAPSVDELRAEARRYLPDHAVPTAYVFMDALPLTVNNKIDRANLPPPSRERPRLATAFAGPGNALERTIVAAWSEVLGLDEVGLDDNFFDLGGTSLRLTAVHALLRSAFDRPVRMVDLYAAPTIRALAELVGGRRDAGTGSGRPTAARPNTTRAAADRGARRRSARTVAAGISAIGIGISAASTSPSAAGISTAGADRVPEGENER